MKMVSYLSFDSPASLPLLLSVLTYLSMLRSSSVARLASEPKSCASRFNKLKSVWFLLKTSAFAFANSFWIIVFFQKLSRNSPLIRSFSLTNSLIVSNACQFSAMLCRFRSKRYSCTQVHSVPFFLSFAPIEKFASHKIYLTKFLHYEIFKVQVRHGVEHLTS